MLTARPCSKPAKPGPGMYMLLYGHVGIYQRDGIGHANSDQRAGAGAVSRRDRGQLSGRPSLVNGRAERGGGAGDPAERRCARLLIAEAETRRERIVRALILRRVGADRQRGGRPRC